MYDNHSFEHNEAGDKKDVVMMYDMAGNEVPVTLDPYGALPAYTQPLDHTAHRIPEGRHSPHDKEEGSGGSDVDGSQKSLNRRQTCRVVMGVILALVFLGVVVAAIILAILCELFGSLPV
ncbi:hypothetical protein ACOMHN_038603 [Nucella lapillus]